MKYSNLAKSECGESPFSRPSNITRHSVKGNRPYFSLLKQPITCNNTGGKTARNSEPVQDDQLFHFSKAGNESSNRMKLLEMRMHQSEFQKNSPYSYSEPRPSNDVEMTSILNILRTVKPRKKISLIENMKLVLEILINNAIGLIF